MYFIPRYRNMIWAASISVGCLLILLPLVSGSYAPAPPYFIPVNQKVNNIIASGLLVALAIPAIVEYSNHKWARDVDKSIPRLLRDVSEAVRSGVTLPRALEEASQRDYGPTTKELERAVSMFSLGATWDYSLTALAKRLRQPSVLRFSTILMEANQTGGRMNEILDSSVDLFTSLHEYREERNSSMRPYLITVYMATLIFLVITYVVLHQFLAPLCGTAVGDVIGESGLLANVLSINYYASILFWASMMESVFGGLVAGKMGGSTLSAGLPHSALMITVTFAFFNVLGT